MEPIMEIKNTRFINPEISLNTMVYMVQGRKVGIEHNWTNGMLNCYIVGDDLLVTNTASWDVKKSAWRFPPFYLDPGIYQELLSKIEMPEVRDVYISWDPPYTDQDFDRMVDLVFEDLKYLAKRNPQYVNADPGAICLAQGTGTHYFDRVNGIKDIDLWVFFANGSIVAPQRRLKKVDFGDPKFGQTSDRPNFVGRRVDILLRNIDVGGSITDSLQWYLGYKPTRSAEFLSMKGMVMLYPERGVPIWNPDGYGHE